MSDVQALYGDCFSGGRASILLFEGYRFDSPGLHIEASYGKMLNPKTAPDVLVGTLRVRMYVSLTVKCQTYAQRATYQLRAERLPQFQTFG